MLPSWRAVFETMTAKEKPHADHNADNSTASSHLTKAPTSSQPSGDMLIQQSALPVPKRRERNNSARHQPGSSLQL